jgi:GTP-binding protein
MENVYEGQIVGQHIRQDDLVINVIKTKKMSNMRAAGSDDKIILTPPLDFSLEEYMEYIGEDEYLEITPKSLRLRKIILNETDRKRANKQ